MDSAIPRLASYSKSQYISHVVFLESGQWRPTVRLPSRTTADFLGRDKECRELLEWFDDDTSRACLVYGEGGVGKTTLVLETLNRIIEGNEPQIRWKPQVICYYSAKQTRWTAAGMERILHVSPTFSEALRELVRVFDEHPGRDWYPADTKTFVAKLETTLRSLGLDRNSVLLVLDNTETLVRHREEESEFAEAVRLIVRRLCRVIITSRRHERIEAQPLELLSLSEGDSVRLIRRLGIALDARPIQQAGDSSLRRVARELAGRPILLEVFVRSVVQGGRSLDAALDMVHKAVNRDLGEFLFQDAWNRIDAESRQVFLLLVLLGGSADETLLSWLCAEAHVSAQLWLEAFAETRFGALRDYGPRFDIALDAAADDFLTTKLGTLSGDLRATLELKAGGIEQRYRKLVAAVDLPVADRVAAAFVSAPAKNARLAAQRGDLEEATLWYEEAVRLEPANAALWDRYAWFLLMYREDAIRARECAKRAIVLSPESSDPHFTAGLVEARLGRIEEADRHLEEAARLGKAQHLCLLQRARARVVAVEKELVRAGPAVDEARTLLERAADITPRAEYDFRHLRECAGTKKRIRELSRRRAL